jgi:NTE family protein
MVPSLKRALMVIVLGVASARVSVSAESVGNGGNAVGQGNEVTAGARPRVCVVLSGGGARGYAHIGALVKLEQLHIPIDCIVGTSIGAVIGGLYASGMEARKIEGAMSKIDLTDVAFDREARADQSPAVRQDNFDYPLGLPIGFGQGRLKMAGGLVQGNHLLSLLQDYTSTVPGDVDFDALPVPFRATATDLQTGELVVLKRGSLPHAMRASMAVPGLFAPVKLDGRTLVDGGIVRNLPIDIAKAMGADIVIAINIGSPLKPVQELSSMASVTQQMVGILISQNVLAQKALLGPSDIFLEPNLTHISFTDFNSANEGIAVGYAAVEAERARLARLSISPEAYARFMRDRNTRRCCRAARVDRVQVSVTGRIPAKRVEDALTLKAGDIYDPATINKDLSAVNSANDFESVSHTITGPDGDRVLHVTAEEKKWGPSFLLFGLGVTNNFDGDGSFAVRIGHRYPWITQSGLSWRNDIVLGNQDLGWKTELRQPLFSFDGLYIAPFASVRKTVFNSYRDDAPASERPITRVQQRELRAGINLGWPVGKLGEVRMGVAQVSNSFTPMQTLLVTVIPSEGGDPITVPMPDPGYSQIQTVGRVETEFDQLDDPLFPRHGYYFSGYAEMALDQAEGNYNTAHSRLLWAGSSGVHSVNVALEAGGQFGGTRNREAYPFRLGGFQHLAAYSPQQFSGNSILYGRVTYMNQIKRFDSGPLQSLFAGATLEAGNVSGQADHIARGIWRGSASVFVGTRTSIGPVYLGVAAAPDGTANIYLQLGNQF